MESSEIKLGSVSYQHPNATYDMPIQVTRTQNTISHSAVLPPVRNGVQAVTSGTIGKIEPTQQPYAFTTVTYAKQPMGTMSIMNESYAAKYAAAQEKGALPYSYPEGRRTRFVRKQRGACGGLNECLGGICDSNGGTCGFFNFGCCDRGQRVPVDVDISPDAGY